MRKINRRDFLKATAVLSAAGALTACGGAASSGTAASSTAISSTTASAEAADTFEEDVLNWKPDQKTITIRVANAAGGQADLIQRLVAKQVQSVTGTTTVVQNITGSSGFLMATDLNSYDPSPCELMLGTEALFAIAPLFNADINISLDDYTALYGNDGATAPVALAVPATLGVNTWEEFLEYAKSNRIIVASNTPGGLTHLQATALMGAAGIEFTSVTDSGGNKNVLACLNGDANCVMVNTGVLHDYVESGKLIPLLQYNPTEFTGWDLAPIPSVKDAGYDIALESCSILCCRKGSDPVGVEAMSRIIVDYLTSDQGIQDLAEINSTLKVLDADTAYNRLKNEVATMKRLYETYYKK